MLALTEAEKLVVKHFKAALGRRSYVILGIGLVNWLAGTAFGYYLEVLEGMRLWLEPFRQSVSRNAPDQIAGLLVSALRASYQEGTGSFPDSALTAWVTAKANAVRTDYLALFPDLED